MEGFEEIHGLEMKKERVILMVRMSLLMQKLEIEESWKRILEEYWKKKKKKKKKKEMMSLKMIEPS